MEDSNKTMAQQLVNSVTKNDLSVQRISRLVDMYYSFHNNLEMNEDKEAEGTNENHRRFHCQTCGKRNWRSIETFRLHKSRCRAKGQNVKTKEVDVASRTEVGHIKYQCVDCCSTFSTADAYKEHVSAADMECHVTHVCPLHCGAAFSSLTCLDLHQVKCLAQQTLGPYHVIDCRNNQERRNI